MIILPTRHLQVEVLFLEGPIGIKTSAARVKQALEVILFADLLIHTLCVKFFHGFFILKLVQARIFNLTWFILPIVTRT